MKIAYYHVDCFTENWFCGNPAAVCIMPSWLPDATLQTMAKEHNLPATAFIKEEANAYAIRWFGPDNEIELCGHGSIAAAYVVFNYVQPDWQDVKFKSPLHTITVSKAKDHLVLNLPLQQLEPDEASAELIKAIGIKPLEVYRDITCLAVLENEQQVLHVQLDMQALRQLAYRNLIITAPGTTTDFVSRNFYPKKVQVEDPVTGSAHCILAPYWAKRLNKNYLTAQQVSPRCGELICEIKDERLFLSGKAILYMKGEIDL
jgi:PhzF family phenazine biosynthesis protein